MNMSLAEILIPFIIGLIVVGGIWFVISQSKKNQKQSGGSGTVGGGVPGGNNHQQEGTIEHESLFDSDGPEIV